jgi:hypothetical protein
MNGPCAPGASKRQSARSVTSQERGPGRKPGRRAGIAGGTYDFPVAAPRKCAMALAITPSKWIVDPPTAASVVGALNAK